MKLKSLKYFIIRWSTRLIKWETSNDNGDHVPADMQYKYVDEFSTLEENQSDSNMSKFIQHTTSYNFKNRATLKKFLHICEFNLTILEFSLDLFKFICTFLILTLLTLLNLRSLL